MQIPDSLKIFTLSNVYFNEFFKQKKSLLCLLYLRNLCEKKRFSFKLRFDKNVLDIWFLSDIWYSLDTLEF